MTEDERVEKILGYAEDVRVELSSLMIDSLTEAGRGLWGDARTELMSPFLSVCANLCSGVAQLYIVDYLAVAQVREREAEKERSAAAAAMREACEAAREWMGDVPQEDGGYYGELRRVIRLLDNALGR